MSSLLLAVAAASGDGWIGRWSPGIGDPTPAGWLTTLAYFAVAWSCRSAALRIKPSYRAVARVKREWLLWRTLALLLAVLGVNKQLDLQSALTELGRMLARSGGWYAERRGVQLVFVAGVAIVALAATSGAAWAARRTTAPARLAVLGSGALLAFVAVRALSFHHFDLMISQEWLGLRVSSLLELAGLAILFAATRWQRRIFTAD